MIFQNQNCVPACASTSCSSNLFHPCRVVHRFVGVCPRFGEVSGAQDRSWRRRATILRLFDPSIPSGLTSGGSFCDFLSYFYVGLALSIPSCLRHPNRSTALSSGGTWTDETLAYRCPGRGTSGDCISHGGWDLQTCEQYFEFSKDHSKYL